MSRPRNEIPKHRKHKGKNLGFFQFRKKRYYTGRWGSREAEQVYRRKIAEIVMPALESDCRSIPDAPPRSDQPTLVEDLAAEFLEHVSQRHPPPSTEAENVGYAVKELLEVHATTRVVDFTPLALIAFRTYLMGEHRREGARGRRTLSRRMVNRRLAFVRRMFKWGVSRELVPVTIWHALTTVDSLRQGEFGLADRPPVQDATIADVGAVLPQLSRVVQTMLRVQLLTGMRSCELISMQKGDINVEGDRWFYRPRRHKTQHHGKSREVELLPAVQRLLAPFMLRSEGAFLFNPREAEAEAHAELAKRRVTRVQPSQAARHERAARNSGQHMNECYSTASYRRAIARACERAGLSARGRAWSPHRIRHAATTYMVKETAGDLPAVALAVGHSSTKTTERYTHLGRDQAAKALKSLESLDELLGEVASRPFRP